MVVDTLLGSGATVIWLDQKQVAAHVFVSFYLKDFNYDASLNTISDGHTHTNHCYKISFCRISILVHST